MNGSSTLSAPIASSPPSRQVSANISPITVSRPPTRQVSAISTHAAVSPPSRQVSAISTHTVVSPPSSQVSGNSSHSTTQNQTQTEEEWTEAETKSQIQPLLELIEIGDFSTIKTELDKIPNASLGRKINPSGETFLHVVIETGNVKLVKYLVGKMGTEHLGLKDMHGDHPLIFAARVGMVDIAEAILVGNGELAKVTNDAHLLPVTVAVQSGNRYMADYLLKKTPAECFSASLAVAAISSDMHHIALLVLKSSGKLAFPPDGQQRNVLSVLAEKPSAFRSGWHFGVLDAIVYEVLGAPSKAQSLVGCCVYDNICEKINDLKKLLLVEERQGGRVVQLKEVASGISSIFF